MMRQLLRLQYDKISFMVSKRGVRLVLFFSVVFFLTNCGSKGKTITRTSKVQQEISSGDSTGKDTIIERAPDKIIQSPYDSVFWERSLVDCKFNLNADQKEDDEFLNTLIKFYEIRSLPERHLINEDYCRFVLGKTRFLFFRDSDFSPGYYNFSHFYTRIDDYGKCFIGKFYFPSIDNSAQRRSIIILQMNLKQVSILNFDDVKFVNGKLHCDFNVRGKHTLFKLKYSKDCKRFVKQ